MIAARHWPLLRQEATPREATARTVNPSSPPAAVASASTVTSHNTLRHISSSPHTRVTTLDDSRRTSEHVSLAAPRGSSPHSSTHFHRRLSATEPVDDASAHEAALRRGRAGRRAVFAGCPPRALPAYPAFHADHRRTGAARSTRDRRPTTPRRRSPSATSVPEPATRAAER